MKLFYALMVLCAAELLGFAQQIYTLPKATEVTTNTSFIVADPLPGYGTRRIVFPDLVYMILTNFPPGFSTVNVTNILTDSVGMIGSETAGRASMIIVGPGLVLTNKTLSAVALGSDYTNIANIPGKSLLGRDVGAGNARPIALGAGLQILNEVLSATNTGSGGGGGSTSYTNITGVLANTLLGGPPTNGNAVLLTVGVGLDLTGGVLSSPSAASGLPQVPLSVTNGGTGAIQNSGYIYGNGQAAETGTSFVPYYDVSLMPQNMLAGRCNGCGDGPLQTITIGTGLTLTGTTLTSGGGTGGGGDYSSISNVPALRLLGNSSGSTANAGAIPLASPLVFAAGALTAGPELSGLAVIPGNGIVTRTTAGTFINRTITAGNGITVTNGDGVAGNPLIGITGTMTVVQFFTNSGTWTKPSNSIMHFIRVIGAGGGGGGGAKAANTTARSGGSGGAHGGLAVLTVPDALLGATETLTVGAGGPGAAPTTVNSTSGAIGTSGGLSSFGSWAVARGGSGGKGGTTGDVTGGAAAVGCAFVCLDGGASSSTVTSVAPPDGLGGGGGGGGGITSANVTLSPATGGRAAVRLGMAGGAPGLSGSASTAGSPGTGVPDGEATIGAGGGGGGASTTVGQAGRVGGDGGQYGGGGGGGGAGYNSTTDAGGGGTGYYGMVQVISLIKY